MKSGATFLLTICCIGIQIQAAVLRKKETTVIENSTATQEETTTVVILSSMEDEKQIARNQNEETTVQIVAENFDFTAGAAENKEFGDKNFAAQDKSAKLLLLSTPKLINKPSEEDVNEDDNSGVDGNVETTTTITDMPEIVTEALTSQAINPKAINKITKLIAVNETTTEKIEATNDPKAIGDKTPEPKNDNVATAMLIENEDEFVLVNADLDAEVEEFGSFTHADSDEHLQPIVQSVEIVPTSFDDPLIVTFVHNL